MGMYHSCYVGPYIKYEFPEGEVEVEKIYRVCPNHHNNQARNRFCSVCGAQIVEQSIFLTEQKRIEDFLKDHPEFEDYAYNIFYDVSTEFTGVSYGILIPNTNEDPGTRTEGAGVAEFDPITAKTEVGTIEAKYLEFLGALKEWTEAEVKYGMINWWS